MASGKRGKKVGRERKRTPGQDAAGPRQQDTYVRVRIEGVLKANAPLHIGSGTVADFACRVDKNAPKSEKHEVEGGFDEVCVGHDNRPYIPASTLRGFLRAGAEAAMESGPLDREIFEMLFGYADEGSISGAEVDADKRESVAEADESTNVKRPKSQAGKLRFHDATLRTTAVSYSNLPFHHDERSATKPAKRGTGVRHRVAIDHITGAAEERKLFRLEYVPGGSSFEFLLEGDDLSQRHVAAILGLLKSLDGNLAAVGRGKTQGFGKLECPLGDAKVSVLTRQKLHQWLASNNVQMLPPRFEPLKQPNAPAILAPVTSQIVKLHLEFDAPVLVNEPAFTRDYLPKSDDESNVPHLHFSKSPDGKALIPGSTLRGVFRARARRILATIAQSYGAPVEADTRQPGRSAGEIAKIPIGEIFGSEGRRSAVWFSEAKADLLYKDSPPQTFNAIDRFTGGVAEGKLYSAAYPDTRTRRFSASARLDGFSGQSLPDWAKGLFLFVLRDAMEGELAIGWGKARGFGSCRIWLTYGDTEYKDFGSLLGAVGREKAQDCIRALHDEISERVAGEEAVQQLTPEVETGI